MSSTEPITCRPPDRRGLFIPGAASSRATRPTWRTPGVNRPESSLIACRFWNPTNSSRLRLRSRSSESRPSGSSNSTNRWPARFNSEGANCAAIFAKSAFSGFTPSVRRQCGWQFAHHADDHADVLMADVPQPPPPRSPGALEAGFVRSTRSAWQSSASVDTGALVLRASQPQPRTTMSRSGQSSRSGATVADLHQRRASNPTWRRRSRSLHRDTPAGCSVTAPAGPMPPLARAASASRISSAGNVRATRTILSGLCSPSAAQSEVTQVALDAGLPL